MDRREQLSSTRSHPEELTVIACDGTRVAVELTSQPIDYLGREATAVALLDLTDRRRGEARIQHLACHDALTDLPNRYDLLERLGHALRAATERRSAAASGRSASRYSRLVAEILSLTISIDAASPF